MQRKTFSGPVVRPDDPRLTDSRTPVNHAGTHASGGTDVVTPAAIGAVANDDARLTDSRTPTAHAGTHATGGTDVLTPAAIGALATGSVFGRRAAITTLAAGASLTVTIPLSSTLANTNYTVTASVEGADLVLDRITARTTTDVSVLVRNTSGTLAASGTAHIIVALD